MHRSQPRDFSNREIPLSQLDRRLSESEESGRLSREAGLLPSRMRQASASTTTQRDPRHVAYVHPPLRQQVPSPSERRSAPRRPGQQA